MRTQLTTLMSVAALAAGAGALPPPPPGVRAATREGIEFSIVGAPGNAGYPESTIAWTGLGNERQGRGSVGYEYGISRTEVTTGQWLEFFNAFAPRPMPANVRAALGGSNVFYSGPSWWGAAEIAVDPANQTAAYALRSGVPDAGMIPVSGISWRTAAMYCNWLCSGKSSDWSALLSGAYDASTWGRNPGGSFTDAVTHAANARFWIPTLDEWAKAAFHDPNRFGPGQGGWWNRVNGSDDLPTPGFPGTPGATTSTGIPETAYFNPSVLGIPLAAYQPGMSPWGLLDTSGGSAEIIEEPRPDRFGWLTMGSVPGTIAEPSTASIYLEASTHPFFSGTVLYTGQGDPLVGLRIATAIPSPGSSGLVAALAWGLRARRRRRAP